MFFKEIVSSITSYFKALKLIKELSLYKYFLVPALLGLILGGIIFSLAFSFSDNIGLVLSGLWKFDFAKDLVSSLSTWLGGFLVLVLGILVYKHLLMALSAPFMSPVSEKIEEHITGQKCKSPESKKEFFGQILRSLRINIRNLILEVLITFPLFILSFIPVLGLLATAGIFYFQSFYTGFGNLDYTLERHLNYSESKDFVKKHKGIAVGNGLIFTLMLFIPFFGIMITLPIATVASTLDSVEKLHGDDLLKLKSN